ncbi:MAG TPA: TIGR03032 family protein [Planctomycetota bacterium]|nr:TIGR03032 family protein [Planctomycetota bacterium]
MNDQGSGIEARTSHGGDPRAHPLRSVHTSSMVDLLRQLNSSIAITTYQAGKVILLRELNGAINTHFRDFDAPMGLAFDGARLAIGTRHQVWVFYNQPDVAERLRSQESGVRDQESKQTGAQLTPDSCLLTPDSCFMPRWSHFTGDINSRDLAWAGDDLWVVNTRFSCLCTLDRAHSFIPRWRPRFVSSLGPEDRCHLNGLCVVDGAPRFVTALGQSDAAEGWREHRANGGCLINVPSGAILANALSMPHSPRWHDGRVWFTESGAGRLSYLDPKSGKPVIVAELPGFTRGLDFVGAYAFVGLSQVRESAVFSGLPITERLTPDERACGLWVVDVRNGQTAGFVRFESGIQEIFAVNVLSGMHTPDLITDSEELLGNSFVLPDAALRELGPPR